MAVDPLSREGLLAYLLGELPAAELAAIDRRLLEDETFGDLLEEARHELLEGYASGRLSDSECEQVRRALHLPREARGGEAGFARALRQAMRQASPDPTPVLRGRGRWGVWPAALAAALVAALGLGLLLRDARLTGVPGAGSPGAPPDSTAAGFVLLLRPAVLRGPSSVPPVRLPEGLRSLQTQIVVPDGVGRYEVQVRSPSGLLVYPRLAPQSANGVSFVQLWIPRARLSSGTYEFLLVRDTPAAPSILRRYSVHLIAP